MPFGFFLSYGNGNSKYVDKINDGFIKGKLSIYGIEVFACTPFFGFSGGVEVLHSKYSALRLDHVNIPMEELNRILSSIPSSLNSYQILLKMEYYIGFGY